MATKTKVKTVKKTETASVELPITITIKLAGQDKVIHTDNVLNALRELKLDETKIKTTAFIEVTYGNAYFSKIVRIVPMHRLLKNDIAKIVTAKQINQNLGIKATY